MKPRSRKSSSRLSKPLSGMSFYFDSKKSSKEQKEVEDKIKTYGGVVDSFLSKDVTYFINTLKHDDASSCNRRSARIIHQTNGSRTNMILRNSAKICYKTPSLTSYQQAKNLGISIQTFSKLKKWLDEVEQHTEIKTTTTPKKSNKNKEIRLKKPFIKIEDRSRKYQPDWEELEYFPKVHFNTTVYECPFKQNSKIKSVNSNKTQPTTSIMKSASTKSGYCELCDSNYKNRSHHLKGKLHKTSIHSTNFTNLDKMINSGTNFQTFVKELDKKKKMKLKKLNENKVTPKKIIVTTAALKKDISENEVLFSPRSSYSITPPKDEHVKKPCNDVSNKRMKLNDHTFVKVNNCTLTIKRVNNEILGSQHIQYPLFENRNLIDRNTKITYHLQYSGSYEKLRRSKRKLAKENGFHHFNCPILVQQ